MTAAGPTATVRVQPSLTNVSQIKPGFIHYTPIKGEKTVTDHVATLLMRRMGIDALYRKPKTTRKHFQHHIYPYLLHGLSIVRAKPVYYSRQPLTRVT